MSTDATTCEASLDPAEVCTLPAEGLGERLAWVRSEILPHAVSGTRGANSIAWELEDAPGVADKLDRLVELERECCSGIVFEHGPGSSRGRRRLEVRGVDPNAAVFASLPLDSNEQAPGGGARLAKAAGLGTAFSLFVCCVLPIGAVALLGAGVAAPLVSLDQPLVIGAAALLSGGAAYLWMGRRRGAAPSSAACGPDC